MSENLNENISENSANESVKEIADALKKITVNSNSEEMELGAVELNSNSEGEAESSKFKVAGANLPAKPSMWTRIKNILFYEIKVELTPYQQKVEREINEFLHQEITWKSLKEAALSEVPITFRGKRIF